MAEGTNNRDISDIEIFSQIVDSRRGMISALFSTQEHSQGTLLIRYGEAVDGLYLLEDGEVTVSIPGFQGVLATLHKGSSFGELSLFNASDLASATVTVSASTARLSFCPRKAMVAALAEDELLAAGFYHGSAILVAERLRTTNQKISGEISKSIKTASALIEEISTSGNLGFAQQEIQSAGSQIVSGMTEILKRLLVMKASGEAIPSVDIGALTDRAKSIYYSEFQVFERVQTQLQVLGAHLENVTRILNHQETKEVEGDMSLLDL
jgi:signal-transduction protein with cAMP-binding, CBS, and nucleotidyltransferase domain